LYGAVLQQGKIKALHRVGCKAKEKPHHVGGVECAVLSTLFAPDVIICCGHDGITAADLDSNAITGASLACIVSGDIQPGHCVISVVSSHNIALLKICDVTLFRRFEQRREKPKEKQNTRQDHSLHPPTAAHLSADAR
jgi:hypothetical protein